MEQVLWILVGVAVDRIVDVLWTLMKRRRAKHELEVRWLAAFDRWQQFDRLAPGLELVQEGWEAGTFSERTILVTLEGSLTTPAVVQAICREHQAAWAADKQKDNKQIGVSAFEALRTADHVVEAGHQLVLRAHEFSYYDFLASNRRLADGTAEERQALRLLFNEVSYSKPVAGFANPLSVGLTLLCENGTCMILTERSENKSGGGAWEGGKIFNAVGETCNARDVMTGEHAGKPLISPWNTAKRGLVEEMGFSVSDLEASRIVLHSFVFDKRILDYKIFGYVLSPLSRTEVIRRWERAPDRHETKRPFWMSVPDSDAMAVIVRFLHQNRDDLTSEAGLATIRTFLLLGGLNDEAEYFQKKR